MTTSRGSRDGGLDPRPDGDDRHDRQPPVVCRKLRTKMAFGALQGPEDWRFGDSTTATYWCLRTMETAGPDESYCHPHSCQRGRVCFAAPDGGELVALADEPDPAARGRG